MTTYSSYFAQKKTLTKHMISVAITAALSLGLSGSAEGAGGLIISEVMDATLPNGLPKYAELTNMSDSSIDLSAYSMGIFVNGSSTFGSSSVKTLSGILAAGDSFVVSFEAGDSAGVSTFFDVFGTNPDDFQYGAIINGNDAIGLYQGLAGASDATLIDILGAPGVDGTGTAWDYTDSYVYRNPGVTFPSASFLASEWTIPGPNALESTDDAAEQLLIQSLGTPGTHVPEPSSCIAGLIGCWTAGYFARYRRKS